MRARFHVALCTLVLPYRTGDVIYLTQAGTDTNRHTQINTHTHTHSPLPPNNIDWAMSKGQWRSLLLIIVTSWILAYLVFFSMLYLFFLVPKMAIFGQWEYLQIVFQVLYDGTFAIFLVSLLSDMTRCFRFVLYSLVFF